MGCIFFAKEPMVIVQGMDSYFNQTQPECSVYSEDHNEFPIHKGYFLKGLDNWSGAVWSFVQGSHNLSQSSVLKGISLQAAAHCLYRFLEGEKTSHF